MKEKYTSEMIKELLDKVIACATSANTVVEFNGGTIGPELAQAIVKDLRDIRAQALLIKCRMQGWDYTAFDEFLTNEVKKKFEEHLQEDEET